MKERALVVVGKTKSWFAKIWKKFGDWVSSLTFKKAFVNLGKFAAKAVFVSFLLSVVFYPFIYSYFVGGWSGIVSYIFALFAYVGTLLWTTFLLLLGAGFMFGAFYGFYLYLLRADKHIPEPVEA